ncbi:kinase-like protein [Hypoxylon crocopeplum]|nr:kinase-like protein [Hypoxylon crocopeplum]
MATQGFNDRAHPLAIFSIVPLGVHADKIIQHRKNNPYVSKLHNDERALNIGHFQTSPSTLATVGRHLMSNIVIPFPFISQFQCSFEIDTETRVITLVDRSSKQTTNAYGGEGSGFAPGTDRRVVIQEDLNTTITMGPPNNLIVFRIEWHQDGTETHVYRREGFRIPSHLARTLSTDPTKDAILPTNQATRADTPDVTESPITYDTIDTIGNGAFGEVVMARDKDTLKIMAVKILRPKKGQSDTIIHREVNALKTLSHPHIVSYIGSQGWGSTTIEIFMELKQGSLSSLLSPDGTHQIPDGKFVYSFLHQVLQALDFLAVKNIIHRDIKPENILYSAQSNPKYLFCLGDFGLCFDQHQNRRADSYVGTPAYMAPEMGVEFQSNKLDIWSLFMTLVWVFNFDEFRDKVRTLAQPGTLTVKDKAITSYLMKYRHMAEECPGDRASAAQMLLQLYDGEGLTTPRDQVRPITGYGST